MIGRIIFLVLWLSFWHPAASVASEWKAEDTALQAVTIYYLATDWKQTVQIAESPKKHYETNPFLGRHPHPDKVHAYFTACIIGHTAIAYMLPKPYRTMWQVTWIAVEVDVTNKNYKLGLTRLF